MVKVTIIVINSKEAKGQRRRYSELTDLYMIVTKSTDKSSLLLSAKGLSKNKYNENGLTATLVSAKQDLNASLGISCKL